MRHMLAIGIVWALGAAAVFSSPHLQSGDPYADRTVDFHPGSSANPAFGNPDSALGPPDFDAASLTGFLNLGLGGSLTVEFTDNVAVDGPGADIKVWGDPANDEQVTVEVSEDGEAYRSFGLVGEVSELDLAQVGLARAVFVRITDDGDPSLGSSSGAELDAVEALHSTSVATDGALAPSPAVQSAPTQSSLAESGPLAWQRLGGPIGGLGYDIRMRPDNPDIMFVTDAWAGVHRSTDGGRTWQPANEGITGRLGESGDAIPVFCLTIDPNDNDIVWAGLQTLGRIYRSEDGGITWQERSGGITEGEGLSFRGISIEPGDSDVVYAAGEISSWNWAGERLPGTAFDRTKGVLYKSVDGGLHWKAVWRGNNLARYIWIHPADPQVLYLSTGIFDREEAYPQPDAEVPGSVGVLRSSDGGETWTPVNTGLGNLYVGSLFVNPRDPDILLAGAGSGAYRKGSGVYLTTDGGVQWQLVMDTASDAVTSVEYSLSDPDIAYAGGQHTFAASADGGLTWQRRERTPGRWGPISIAPGFPIDFQVDPRDPDRIFANNYGGGNFLSEDGGRTWASASAGYTGADIRSLAVDPRNPATVYANGRSGPFVSEDGGRQWRGINTEAQEQIIEGSQLAIDPSDPRHLIMTESNRDLIYFSDDRGATWEQPTRDWGDLSQVSGAMIGGIEALAFAPSEPDRVYAVFGNNGCKGYGAACDDPQVAPTVATSGDGGRSWREAASFPHNGMPGTSVIVHPQDADRAWVAGPGFGVFQTTDGGGSWTPASQLATAHVVSLAIDPTGDLLLAGTLDRGVYVSTDGGSTWHSSNVGMDPNEPVFTIVISPTHPDTVFAGSMRSGVFRSQDAGKSWTALNQGLRTRSVHDLAMTLDGETLYAGTRGEGVFRLSAHEQEYFDSLAPTQVPAAVSTVAATAPTAPIPASPTATGTTPPPAEAGRGVCGGIAALPAVMLGLVAWARPRRPRRPV